MNTIGIPKWVEQGPRPIINAQVNAPPNNYATGAVESIAINPKPNRDNTSVQIYVGSANGGVWRTNKADPSNPDATEWTALTDQLPSLSMGDIAFSPLDPLGNTLFAGTGIFSSDHDGGPPIGVIRTTDGGATWKVFPLNPRGPEFPVKTILPTSIDLDVGPGIREIVLVGTVGGGGLYRSDDNGESYTLLSGANGLPSGDISQLIVDPNNSQRFYVGVPKKGIFRGDYDPVISQIKWTPVNSGIKPDSISTAGNIQIAAGHSSGNTVLFALLSGSNRGAFRSTNGGATWTTLATPPGTPEFRDELFGNDAAMESGNTIIVDPTNDQVAYIATYGGFDNIFRYNYNPAGAGSWDVIDGGGAKGDTRPHDDFRDLAFQGSNILVVSTDGGVYFIQNPLDSAHNAWQSYNGSGGKGLGTVEFVSIAWDSNHDDSNSGIIFGGTQDNGTPSQQASSSLVYEHLEDGDGLDVGVDNFTLAGKNQSIRYYNYFSLDGINHLEGSVFDAANNPVGNSFPIVPAGGLKDFITAAFALPVVINAIAPPDGQSTRIAIGGWIAPPNVTTGEVYESNDAGTAVAYESNHPGTAPAVHWQRVPPYTLPSGVTALGPVGAMVYGGRRNGVDNPDVLYVGYSGTDQDPSGKLLVRTSAGGNLTPTPTPFPGSGIRGITLDPSDWKHAFVISSTGVWETPDAGGTWNNDTGNLPSNDLRTVQYIASGAASALLVGGLGGVFRMITNEPRDWTEYGLGMPNTVTYALDYNEADNVLLAGTLGRGAWTVPSVRSTVFTPGVIQVNGDGKDVNIRLVRDPNNTSQLDVYFNGTLFGPYQLSTIDQINVYGLGGKSTLIVDSSNGLIKVPNGIHTSLPPTVSVGPDATIPQKGSLSRTGSFSDPGADTWTATVDYGDGSGSQPLATNADKTFRLNHTYASAGTFPVTVVVTDGNGSVGLNSFLVVVAPIPVAPPPVVPPQPSPSPQPIVGPVPITTFGGQFPQPTVGPLPMTSFAGPLPQVQVRNDLLKTGRRPLSVNRTVNLKRPSPLSPSRVRLGQRLAVGQPHPAGPMFTR